MRHEIDDTEVFDWRMVFEVMSPDTGKQYSQTTLYEQAQESMPDILAVLLTVERSKAIYSMTLRDCSQARAINLGFAALTDAFERIEVPFSIIEARMATTNIPGHIIDVSLYAIDLERALRSVQDLEPWQAEP